MTPDEFREYGHKLIDWIADYRADDRRAPGDGRRPSRAQVEGRTAGRTARRTRTVRRGPRDLDSILVPGLTHWQHPRFFGYFPANAPLASVLGDLLSTGLGVLGLNWQASPALTELEEVVCDWMRQMVGPVGRLERRDSGHRLDREPDRAALRPRADHELLARPRRAAGRAASRSRCTSRRRATVPSRRRRCSRGSAARTSAPCRTTTPSRCGPMRSTRWCAADIAAGNVPCAVVATTGTTASTALDPVGRDRGRRGAAQPVAARRCRDGRLGDDPARVPVDVGRRRAGRLGRVQPAQVARGGVRLLAVLRPRPRPPRSRDVHQPELPANRGRRDR